MKTDIMRKREEKKARQELDLLALFAVDHETRQYFKENFNKKLAQLEEVTK